MNWIALILVFSSVTAWSQSKDNLDFVGAFTKGTRENAPGYDPVFCNFTFSDASNPKLQLTIKPKKIIPISSTEKLPIEVQQKLKIKQNDGLKYFFLNYLEEKDLSDGLGKFFKGPASITRMMRKNVVNNDVEFLNEKGVWNKVLSNSASLENLSGMIPQSEVDTLLKSQADDGIRPVELTALLKDPEIVCHWIGKPTPFKLKTDGSFAKKYFCRADVDCRSDFILEGNDTPADTYEVSCANDKADCSDMVKCMEYDEDEEFKKLKPSFPKSATKQ